MNTFTPGPWTVIPEKLMDGQHVAGRMPIIKGGSEEIARVLRQSYLNGADEEGESNARLIAAAPEEHAALKRLTHAAESFAGSDPDMPSHVDAEAEFEAALTAAYQAIALAEGAPPPGRTP